MTKSTTQILPALAHVPDWARRGGLVVGATLFIAVCAHVTLPLPFTPVPLTLQNFAVLLVGLILGSRAGFAALVLYLAEGAAGLPVFNPAGVGGLAQLVGLTGGFLLAYPFMAATAGWIMEQGSKTFLRATAAGIVAEIVLFAGGIGWLAVLTHSFNLALRFGLYGFIFAEMFKILWAASISYGWQRIHRGQR